MDWVESKAKFLLGKLGITEQEFDSYVNKNILRILVVFAVFCVELLVMVWLISFANWHKRGFAFKSFALFLTIILLVLFEFLRFADPFIKKHYRKKNR